jgi:DNA-binding response OmpR family regulator
MSDKLGVLLIEDNPGDARLIREMLAEVKTVAFDLEWADRLSTGLERLAEGGIDVVLLDLALPDSQGLDTFARMHAQAQVPVIVLSCLDDEGLALEAVRQGAQDYLVKGQVDGNPLARAIRYAVERQRMEESLRQRNRELALLHRAGQSLTSSLDLDQVLDSVLEEVRRLLGVVACSVWLSDQATGELRAIACAAGDCRREKGLPDGWLATARA